LMLKIYKRQMLRKISEPIYGNGEIKKH
jgi:hypothetical protein